MSRPRIGICTALEPARWAMWEQRAALLPSSYIEAVQQGGGLALMIPPDPQLVEDPSEALAAIDGLMLVGGADIDPAAYGERPHPRTTATCPERDAVEIALVRAAIAQDVPLLGICRGMQLINVALGGTLMQHLPERFGHDDHLRREGTFDGADHDVQLQQGTLIAAIAGETLHSTKSHHHQGVERVGEGLVVTGTAPVDDLPEALELPGRRFVLGVQWHPEADPSSPVVGAFVDAARQRRAELGTRDGHRGLAAAQRPQALT
ncbi:MAG TPA: gamma-glutamyl-gamma-aminobutyrate hydrolase family protein [Solirubrobacteraceae bacterium]|jgi:putative glutamine amidotransferase